MGAVWLQELAGKDQERVGEVSRVKVELQEQIALLQAEMTAQGGLKAKINALERELKGSVTGLLCVLRDGGSRFIYCLSSIL